MTNNDETSNQRPSEDATGTPSPELPGIPSQSLLTAGHVPRASRGGSRLVAGLTVAVLVLVAALALAILRPWDGRDEAKPDESAAPSQSDGNSNASEGPRSALQKEEAELAAEKKWKAGEEYIPTVNRQGQKLIDGFPKLDDASGLTLGPADAPVTVRIFGDFSCPVCTKLDKESTPALKKLAGDGKIRLEWHNFVIFEKYGSDKAARATLAAAAQGRGWDYVEAVYGSAGDGDHPTYTDESVRSLAQGIDLDMTRFDADYASAETDQKVKADTELAQKTLGLRGTPSLIVGYAYAGGAYPSDVLTNTVELQIQLAK